MNPGAFQDCWKRIGVLGDHSCPELPRHIHCRNCPAFVQGARTLLDHEPPPGYVEERTRLLARGKDVEAAHTDVVMVFRVGTEWLALAAAGCVEVVALRAIRHVPHRRSRLLAGLTGVRGEILLCFSLAELLGLDPAGPETARFGGVLPRLLIARDGSFRMAFPVDEVFGLHRFAADTVEPVPVTNARAVPTFCRGILSVDGRKVGWLDEQRVFRALEKELT